MRRRGKGEDAEVPLVPMETIFIVRGERDIVKERERESMSLSSLFFSFFSFLNILFYIIFI